ncbi:MAG: ABC transporter ATP-binding protein [Candidatus Binatus sp.]|uniref:ABC transporter ATP-binding protein n=1 Tax=Candidatus Binatus sp. TaxID=2811406 RepID=UPI0027157454|nr:ABC transporter ATP-binding protein [Candidatus Binatus sp.]MDO8433290.1 ABC transporter ATP-binding protein [Candidatus Binatus sp.]
MIEVQDLTKYFGATLAVNHVSFRVEKGEIIGLLGPNGSGKTTIMRILTGFFPPTSGRALIGGLDVAEHSLETRRRVGYLPENMVLYPDLTVTALLEFGARVRELDAKTTRDRIEFSLETCGLKEVRRKLIGKLSKGYRQRVGIAQAILSDPEVLILDEPTVGLDPRQVVEIRELILSLAGRSTVLLSTHILPEINMTCRRVLIIDRGIIVAQDTPEQLTAKMQGTDQTLITVGGPAPMVREALSAVNYVERLQDRPVDGGAPGVCSFIALSSGHGEEVRSALAACVVQHGWNLLEVKPVAMSLEDLFMRLVTKEERV